MSKRGRPDPRRAKLYHSYTVAEVAKLYEVHRNTVRAWIAKGLDTIKSGRLILILGADLRTFLEKRQKARRSKTPPGHLHCFRCRAARLPAEGLAELHDCRGGTGNVAALCGCGALMNRRVGLGRIAAAGFAYLAPHVGTRT